MSDFKKKIAFLKDCLEAESRSQTLWNVRTTKSEQLKPLDMSWVRGSPSKIPIKQSYFDSLEKVLHLYSREKKLMMARVFIVAYHNINSFGGQKKQLKKICCPIIYFPCSLSNEYVNGKPVVKPDLDRGVINPAALQFFEHHKVDATKILEQLLSDLSQVDAGAAIEWKSINKLTSLLKSPDIWVQPANSKVDTTDTASCLKTLDNDPTTVHFKDDALLYIVRKSASAQGSMYELERLMKYSQMSSAMSPILSQKRAAPNISQPSFWQRLFRRQDNLQLPLPVVLSDAQTKVVSNASEHNLSVAVGPPGTGKSFTIASLALKEFTKGHSVLVVSQNQHAVDVVRRKLIDDFGIDPDLTVLGSDEGISRDAQSKIVEFCNAHVLSKENTSGGVNDYDSSLIKLDDLIHQRSLKEASFLSACNEHTDEQVQEKPRTGFFSWFTSSSVNNEAQSNTDEQLLSEQFSELEELDDDINVLTAKLINLHYQRRAHKLRTNAYSRASIKTFASSLSARNGYYQERYYHSVNFAHVLGAVPFWFASLSSLHRLLPLKKEMFDVVIIDEASQCNLSVSLPALYRAKRAVVVGDPKQLNHFSFVSYDAQQSLFERYGLNENELSSDFRNNSVLDYVLASLDSSSAVTQLDEHFRSHPQIIGYSNEEFYDNSLKVMTTRPNRVKQAVTVRQVKGKRTRGVNRMEADAVIDEIKVLIEQQADFPEADVQSLGVLSFFSNQAQHIEKKLLDTLSLNQLRRHNIRVGTPFSFQGEERDHMIISCCVDAKTSSSSYTYLNRDDVFNVAITRARDFQTLFLSCEPEEIKQNSKLKSYIRYCQKQSSDTELPEEQHESDSFQNEIYTWLQQQGIKAYKNYRIAGISIDLMAVYEDRALAIDLVGFDGDLKGSLSLKQFKLLSRAGLNSFLFPYDEWRNDRERLLEHFLLQLGVIAPLEERNKNAVGVFNDEQENFISKLTDGISINQLNARFVRANERRAAKQIKIILGRLERFEYLLHLCFMPEELTFKRYKNAYHDLIKDCVIKLQQASIASELASSLLEQQRQLFGKPSQYGEEYDDIFSARASMIDEQKNRIQQLLHVNEAALLQMDKTCLKLNELYESADDSQEMSHDILKELTEKIDLYKGITLNKNN